MEDSTEIVKTLDAANLYLKALKELTHSVNIVEQQIRTSHQNAVMHIECTFNGLIENITTVLTRRKNSLLNEINKIKEGSQQSLNGCQNDINMMIKKTEDLINNGKNLQNGSGDISEFKEQSALLGSLPEVPDLREVPYISFYSEDNLKSNLLDICSQFGNILKFAPVQISELVERPGGILVKWKCSENDEKGVDVQEYCLQKIGGDVTNGNDISVDFVDCYRGSDTQFLVKELQVNQLYSFRVNCKYDGNSTWGAWSVIQVGSTSMKGFSWGLNQDYRLADENRIAIPLKHKPSLLLSNGPQFFVGCSVEFMYIECDDQDSTIGLMVTDETSKITDMKSTPHHFCVQINGDIFIDGVLKTTKLPTISKGHKVTFTTESSSNKVRVSVDFDDKIVTYDWQIPVTSKIYFAASIKSPNTRIMVE